MPDVKLGITDRTVTVFVPDPASTDGSGKTGLAHTDMTVSYTRVETDNDVVVTDVTSSLNALTNLTDAHNDWGWKEVSSTVAPGLYRIDIADAVFAAGAWEAIVYVMITSSAAAASPTRFGLVAFDPLDTVRLGLTALPNAAAEASGGLPTLSAAQASNGTINANVHRWLTGTPNALQSGRVDSYLGAVANGVIAAASFAANALDAVWSTAARVLTAGTNIVLAKGTGVTGFNDLDASGIRSAVGLGSADLDTQLSSISNKTVNLPIDPADQSLIIAATNALSSQLSALNNLDAAGVWSYATRILTAGTNIVLAKGTGVTGFNDLDAAGIRAAVGLNAANLDTQLAGINTKTINLPAAPAGVGDTMTLTSAYDYAKGTVAMTESYAANGAAPTPIQAHYAMHQMLMHFTIAGVAYTVKKLNGTDTAFVVTLDSATTPTAAARS